MLFGQTLRFFKCLNGQWLSYISSYVLEAASLEA